MRLRPVGDVGVEVRLPEGIAPAQAFAAIHGAFPDLEVTPGADAVFISGDVDPEALEAAFAAAKGQLPVAGTRHEIPVWFGGHAGPDLRALARLLRRSEQAVIDEICAGTYEVAFLGFLPGFPYLSGLQGKLSRVHRRRIPRTRVPRGAVGLAAGYMGIYPFTSPGGWNILGQTPELLFEAKKTPPTRFKPGDVVTFKPITEEVFHHAHHRTPWRAPDHGSGSGAARAAAPRHPDLGGTGEG